MQDAEDKGLPKNLTDQQVAWARAWSDK